MSIWVVSGSIVKTSEKRPTSLQGPKDLFPMRSLFGGFTVHDSSKECMPLRKLRRSGGIRRLVEKRGHGCSSRVADCRKEDTY